MRLGDVDNETAETFTLTAFDGAGRVTAAWLEQPVFLSGATPSQFQQANLPSWSFDGATGVYIFTGVPINTLLTLSLQTNRDLTILQVDKSHVNNGFGLAAPEVPEPGAFLLLSSGLVALGLVRRRRRA